jgi:hypothetical protein
MLPRPFPAQATLQQGQDWPDRRRPWPERLRESLPPTFSSSQPSDSLGKGLCQKSRTDRLQTVKTACSRRPNLHKKLISTAIGRVRDFFHELPLKLYLCLLCCQRRMPVICGIPRKAVRRFGKRPCENRLEALQWLGRLNAADSSRHNPSADR